MPVVNRTAIVLRPKQPFIDWINETEPDDRPVTLKEVAEDNVVYLNGRYLSKRTYCDCQNLPTNCQGSQRNEKTSYATPHIDCPGSPRRS